MKLHRRISLTTRFVVIVGLVMMLTNILLGSITLTQSRATMKSLIGKNMLDITNTAAALLNGDELGALTEEDVDGPVFNKIKAALAVYQNNADIEFIYAVRQTGPDSFVFTVDPDPVSPGAFGEEIVVTDGLRAAGQGVPSVDSMAVADRWGNFYSAFSPVFDSTGAVAGIVGIDFSAEWYESQIQNHMIVIGVVSALSVLVGIVVVAIIVGSVQAKFTEIGRGLSLVSADVERLRREIDSTPDGEEAPELLDNSGDELELLSARLQSIQGDLKNYLDYLHVRAYTDGLTGVGNSTAYHEHLVKLKESIEKQDARFAVALFDIDRLKNINDCYGHVCGDRIIRGAADTISSVFRREEIFRIGGDEFIAIVKNAGPEAIDGKLSRLEQAVRDYNARAHENDAVLGLSAGAAVFDPAHDRSFRDVFVRADETMYRTKGEHHLKYEKAT